MPKRISQKSQKPATRIAANAVAMDLDLRLGSDEPLAIQMVDQSGKTSPRFSIAAYSGGTFRQWWSADPVVVNLAGMRLPKNHKRLVVLRDHDMARPIGNAVAIRKTDRDLSLDGDCTVPGAEADQFVTSSKNGFPWRASIGAGSTKVAYVKEGETLQANGRIFTGPLTHVVACELREVSVVTMGADDETDSVAATDEEKNAIMKRIRATASGATPPAAIAPPVEAGAPVPVAPVTPPTAPIPATPPVTAAAQPAALAPGVSPDFTAQRDAQAAELTRVGAINAMVNITPAIAAQAIKDGWSVDRTELHVLRASRQNPGPGVLIPSAPEMNGDVFAAAICAAGGLDIGKHFPVQACEVAQKAFRGSIGLKQLLVMAAQQNGWRGDTFLRSNSAVREVLAAGFSSGNLASVLSNAANKFLMDAFNSVEDSWRLIASVNPDVQDFRQYNTYAFCGDLTMKPLGQGGQIQHGTLLDIGYSNQIGTVARMMTITREDIINDNIGILRGGSQRLGRGAALALNLIFWKEFADNATFFAVANNNYLSGATMNMSSAGLAAATIAFRKQVGPDNNPLGVDPRILVVPAELEFITETLLTSTQINTGGASTETQVPNRNIWAGKYQLAVTSYLSNATAVGAANASALAWYLLADPKDMPTIEVGFLRGAIAPTIEDVQPEPDVLGVSLRGFYDLGVKKQVPQGGVKSKGAA